MNNDTTEKTEPEKSVLEKQMTLIKRIKERRNPKRRPSKSMSSRKKKLRNRAQVKINSRI